MIVRIWKVELGAGQGQALEAFARRVSLPMFRAQPGCLGVFFSRTDAQCATLTVWDREESVAALEASERYRQVVREIESSGLLGASLGTEVFTVYGGFVADRLAAWGRTVAGS